MLLEAATGELTDGRELPWYVKALLISQPLHFGDYGGMPLKSLWAVLDLITILVLLIGRCLWYARWRRQAAGAVDAAHIAPAMP